MHSTAGFRLVCILETTGPPRVMCDVRLNNSDVMKTTNAVTILWFVCFVAFTRTAFADPGIVGDTVSVSRQIPSIGFTFGPYTNVVLAGPADTVALSLGTNSYINVEDSSLLLTFGPHGGSGGPYGALAHFILFQDLSPTAPIITGLSYETDLQGFVASNILFTAHTVTIGEGGIDWSGGQFLNINLQFQQIPEPSSLVLFGIGVMTLTTFWRRKSNKPAAPNAAMTSLFEGEHHWRGIGEPER
jgi:hypothetical protein